MTKISGWVFLSIGILLTTLSFYINSSQRTNSMTVFIYLGYLFIAYGIAKVAVKFIMNKDKPNKNSNKQLPEVNNNQFSRNKNISKNIPNPNYRSNIQNNNKININKSNINSQTRSQNNDLYGYIGFCSRCGTPMRKINIYCHRCGNRQIK
jgi:hypothetical protein